MYQKQIEQLVMLQAVDDEIIRLKQELADAPKELDELVAKLDEFNDRKEQICQRSETLQQQRQKLDDEIEEDANRIRKSKNKLMMVANTKEYHAMMREMDSLEKLNRMREEERVAVAEELERQAEELKEVDEEMAGVQERHDAKRATLEERVVQAQDRLDALDKQRKKVGKTLSRPVLGRYEFIRSRIENPVIVPVEDGICGGCHIMIPPQSYNELQKGSQILSCPNCQRLIYWVRYTPCPDQSEGAAEEAVKSEA